MAQRIQLRRGTAAEWAAANPVLALGEPGVETDTGKQKFGNGVTPWNDRPYASKGDKGDPGAPGIADDASVAQQVTNGTATKAALSATYAPASGSTAYAAKAVETKVANAPVSTSLGVYDRRLNVYNLKPTHLRRTRGAIARARAGTGTFTFAPLGDSTVAGVGATPSATSWPAQFVGMAAAAGIPTVGTGIVPGSSGSNNDDRWAYSTGQWGDQNTNGYMKFTQTNGATATFTSNVAGTTLNLWYNDQSSPFTVKIDGGSAVTVTPTGASALKLYTVTGLANTTHTVIVTAGGTYMGLVGIEIQARTTGLRLFNGGLGSRLISAATDTSSTKWSTMGYLPVATGTAGFNADLVALMMETNDTGSNTPIATYKASYQTAINNLKANGADIILITAIPTNGYNLTPYTQAIYEMAETNDLPLIDLQDRWGTWATMNTASLVFDALHPNAAGYADIARNFFNVIAP